MPDKPEIVKPPDPLQGLRAAVDAHRQVALASSAAGAAVQAAKVEQPTSTEPAP